MQCAVDQRDLGAASGTRGVDLRDGARVAPSHESTREGAFLRRLA